MIHLNVEQSIYVITIDSGKGNLMTDQDINLLTSYIVQVEDNDEIKGMIITGTKNSLCTGLSWENIIPDKKEEQLNYKFKILDNLLIKLYGFSKPLTVAANGYAIGAGFLIMLCADYVYIPNALTSKWGLPEIKIGLGLDELMVKILSSNLNPIMVKNLLYSGDYLSPNVFASLGLVHELLPDEDVVTSSMHKMQTLIQEKYEPFRFIKMITKRENCKELKKLFDANCFCELTSLCLK